MTKKKIKINRAPVMTLRAVVIAERLGYDHATALTLGKSVSDLNAQSKGQRLGIYEKPTDQPEKAAKAHKPREQFSVPIFGRAVPAQQTPQGVRATSDGKPIDPDAVLYCPTRFEKKWGGN